MSRPGWATVRRAGIAIVCVGTALAAFTWLVMRQVNAPISTSGSLVRTLPPRPAHTLTSTSTPTPSPSPTDPVLAAFDMPRHPKRLVDVSVTVNPDATKSDTYDVSSSITLTVAKSDLLMAQIRDGAIQVADDGDLVPTRRGPGIQIGDFATQSWTPYLSVFTPGGASTSYSEVDNVDTSSLNGPFILTWSAPSWAEPTDTFKLALHTPKLDILGVKGAVPATEDVSNLTLDGTSSSAKIAVAIGTEDSLPFLSDCTSPFPCPGSSQASSSASNAAGTDSAPEYKTVFDWIEWALIGAAFFAAAIATVRTNRRVGVAALVAASTISGLFFISFGDFFWDFRAGNVWVDLRILANETAFVVLCSLPFLLARSPVAAEPAWRRLGSIPTQVAAGVIALLLSAQTAGYLAQISRHTSIAGVIAAALVGVIAMGIGLRAARAPLLGAAFVAMLLLWAALVQSDSTWRWLNTLLTWSIPVSMGLIGAVVVTMVLETHGARLSLPDTGAVFILFALCMMPFHHLLYGDPDSAPLSDLYFLTLFLASDVLLVVALIIAHRRGANFLVYSVGPVRGLLFSAFALVLALPAAGDTRSVGICASIVLLTFFYAVPGSRAETALQLSAGSPGERRALIIELAKERVLKDRAKSVYREAVANLALPEAQPAEIESQAHAAIEVLTTTLDADVVERAFAAPPGTTPWRSGVTAAAIAVLLSVPFFLFALRGNWSDWLSVFNYDALALAVPFRLGALRAVFFAFIYGFYYPQLRGVTSLGKSIRFCAFILPADLVCAALSQRTGDNLAKALIVEAAQLVTILMVLGAVWEFRAMRSAGLPWSVLRRFRGLHTLSGPVSAVLAAAVTAAVTTFVTSYAHVQISPQNPAPASTASPSPSNGHGHG